MMTAWMRRTARTALIGVLTLGCMAASVGVARAQSSAIVAVVNSDVITRSDVDNRTRLFALTAGVVLTPEMLDRLRPQVTKQLIDERLRLQEAQRRHIIIGDKQIAETIRDIETHNGMQPEALRQKLTADGVSYRTLVDQIRVQAGWLQVIRQQLGDAASISNAEVAEQQQLLSSQTGKPEYRLSEIFIPVESAANVADAQRFADTVIAQLRSGAPFAVAAAQFSQSQTALQGGDLGWVQPTQLDPKVAEIAAAMPVGAVSNPLRVPGGFSIVSLRARREIGRDVGTMLSIRTLFLPFPTPLNPQAPTEQQRAVLERAKGYSTTVHSCEQMEAAAKAVNSPRPADPGEVRLENVNPPAFKAILSTLPEGKATQPLVAQDGISIVIVCSREQKNLASEGREEIERRLLAERAELAARQLQRDLQRRAQIDLRDDKGGDKSVTARS